MTYTISWEDLIDGNIPEGAARNPDGSLQIAGFWEYGVDDVRGWSGKRYVTLEEQKAENAICNAKFDAIRAELVEQFGDPATGEDANRDAFYAALERRTRRIRISDEEVRAHLDAARQAQGLEPLLAAAESLGFTVSFENGILYTRTRRDEYLSDVDPALYRALLARRDALAELLGGGQAGEVDQKRAKSVKQPPPPAEPFTPEVPVDYPEDIPQPPPAWENPELYAEFIYWFGEGKPGQLSWQRLDICPIPENIVRVPSVRWDIRRGRWQRDWLYAEMTRQEPPKPEPGVLDLDVARKLNLSVEDLIGVSAAVLGIRGSGKTNTAAVLVEELLAAGVPMTIVDPESEYWSLKERFDILVVGRSGRAEIHVGIDGAAALADFSVRKRVPVILDLDGFRREERSEFLLAYFRALWDAADAIRQPYQVLLEEAHVFAPQGKSSELKEELVNVALRGRKRGLGIVAVSQRSANVDKDLLSQSSILLLHRVTHPTDLNVYKDLVPMKPAEINRKIPALEPGQVCALVNHEPRIARIRKRHTFHAGATPGLYADTPPALRKIDEALLEELRRAVAGGMGVPA